MLSWRLAKLDDYTLADGAPTVKLGGEKRKLYIEGNKEVRTLVHADAFVQKSSVNVQERCNTRKGAADPSGIVGSLKSH